MPNNTLPLYCFFLSSNDPAVGIHSGPGDIQQWRDGGAVLPHCVVCCRHGRATRYRLCHPALLALPQQGLGENPQAFLFHSHSEHHHLCHHHQLVPLSTVHLAGNKNFMEFRL